MPDHATPNLPARDFEETAAFYARLGFEEDYRSEGWMILSRGNATLEFFPYPDLDPYQSRRSKPAACPMRGPASHAITPPLPIRADLPSPT